MILLKSDKVRFFTLGSLSMATLWLANQYINPTKSGLEPNQHVSDSNEHDKHEQQRAKDFNPTIPFGAHGWLEFI